MLIDSDATAFSGYFLQGRRDGMGVERRSNGSMSLQLWQDGVLQEAQTVASDPRCRADDADGAWMVKADACINGWPTATVCDHTDGEHLVTAGRWILGQRVKERAWRYLNLLQAPAKNSTGSRTSNHRLCNQWIMLAAQRRLTA